MEDQYSEDINSVSFLHDKHAKKYFARVDYYLKSGGHIQREYPKPAGIYRFVEENFESLKLYYEEFFRVILSRGGDEFRKFYYIDFEERNRGEISQEHRQVIQIDIVIIGMLFLKLYQFDGNIDLDKVSDFIALLLTEYEDEKETLAKLILNTDSLQTTDRDEEILRRSVKNAFKKFAELGWIYWEDDDKDQFHLLPSFERLRKMYEVQILSIDELIKEVSDA